MVDTGYFTGGILYTPPTGAGPATDLELGTTDANGTAWLIRSWQGMDGAPTAGQVVQRGGDHGGWATPQWYAGRPITLTIQATARTQALRDKARAAMQQAVPIGMGGGSDLATLRWDEPVPIQMAVRRSGPIVETYMTLLDVIFSVPLIAPDPRKYSTTLHSQTVVWGGAGPAGLAPPLTPPLTLPAGTPPMAVTATNAGSFETRPVVTIFGPVTAPGILNLTTGQKVTYSGLTLVAGDVLAIDLLNRGATLNGVYRAADISASWFVCPPGATTIQMTGTGASGASMAVAWRDAWI